MKFFYERNEYMYREKECFDPYYYCLDMMIVFMCVDGHNGERIRVFSD